MNKLITNLLKIMTSGIISLALLSVCCRMFYYSGVHIRNQDGSTDYKCEAGQFISNIEEGFSWIHIDKNGFNNENNAPFDEQPIDILVVGSSQMEAMQVKSNEGTAALLNELLPMYRTYNIGMSSHRIYSCVQNLTAATNVFNPKKYVVLETEYVDLDVDSMNQVINNMYPEIPTHDTGIGYWLQNRVPALKRMFTAMKNWVAASTEKGSSATDTEGQSESNINTVEYEKTLNLFLKKAKESISENSELIIFLQPVTEIDEKGNYKKENSEAVELFAKLCDENDIIFIDETANFISLYDTHHVLAHGFSNTAIGYGHLNQYGHQVIAESLANIITERECKENGLK